MKKSLCLILSVGLMISAAGCNSNKNQTEPQATDNNQVVSGISSITSVESLEEKVAKDVKDTVKKLESDRDNLAAEINTYEKYINNVEKVEAFYNNAVKETNQLGIRLREYALRYAQLILDSNADYKDKYKDLKGIKHYIYKDAGKDMFDIYDDVIKEMYDLYYSGIIKDAYNVEPYEEYSNVRSDEYDLYSDTRSDIYDIYSDTRSDIYDFGSDIRSAVYDQDDKRIQKKMDRFKEDIMDLKNDK